MTTNLLTNMTFDIALDGNEKASLCKAARQALSYGYPPETIVRGTRKGVVVIWGVAGRLSKLTLREDDRLGFIWTKHVPMTADQKARLNAN